ncbi:MAG: hypothetical protein ACTSRA_13555 [Promethearchaeota archaeon]
MEKIVKKFKSFQEAEKWEIQQQIRMTPSQRQAIAKELRERFYGKNNPDVREYHGKK